MPPGPGQSKQQHPPPQIFIHPPERKYENPSLVFTWGDMIESVTGLVRQLLLHGDEHVVETPAYDHVVVNRDHERHEHAGNTNTTKVRRDFIPTCNGTTAESLANCKFHKEDRDASDHKT